MKALTTKEMVKTARGLLEDHGMGYAEEHKKWLVSTGIHSEYAEAIIDMAIEDMQGPTQEMIDEAIAIIKAELESPQMKAYLESLDDN
jgi:hypothetical protein